MKNNFWKHESKTTTAHIDLTVDDNTLQAVQTIAGTALCLGIYSFVLQSGKIVCGAAGQIYNNVHQERVRRRMFKEELEKIKAQKNEDAC